MKDYIIPVLIGSIVILCIYIYFTKQRHENYDISGALAPYTHNIGRCMSECDKEDPSRILGHSGNTDCYLKCRDMYTDAAASNLIVDTVYNNIEVCQQEYKGCCGHTPSNIEQRDRYINKCACKKDVIDYCKTLVCPHSGLNNEECMKQCVSHKINNCISSGWTWK